MDKFTSSTPATPAQSEVPLVGQSSRFRGLPASVELRELVTTYLTNQHKHWPELVGTAALPEISESAISNLATIFESAYRTSQFQSFTGNAFQGTSSEVGAVYIRYSDENSNSRSLDQQLTNVLRTAHATNVFIPWQYVFADAAISGTTTARNGYQMLRDLVQSSSPSINRYFTDDLDRLNRDLIESHQFVGLLELHGKRLNTANGFDSTEPMSKVAHSFKAMQNEFFVDQLKEKVTRGMIDAGQRGRNLGLPPTGFKTVPKRDPLGNPIVNRNGKCENQVVIDEDAAAVVRRIFAMYVEQKMSGIRISRVLNQEQALGRTAWSAATIFGMLKNERYIGIYKWRTTRTVDNPNTGKKKGVPRPVSEHLRMEQPDLRIIDDGLWEATQKRLAEASRKTRPAGVSPKSRQSLYPTRLFDLYCRDCDRPLRLDRTGKYSHLCCARGKEKQQACSLHTSKSLSIIDDCILAHLRKHFLGQADMDSLLAQANVFLAEEAAKPATDTIELERQIVAETDKIKRIAQRLAILNDGPTADTLMVFVQETELRLGQLRQELALATTGNVRPTPIDTMSFQGLLNDLRSLLQEDIPASHAVLAKALGRVYVTQGPKRGHFYTWIAELNINPIPVLLEIAKKNDCPTLYPLDYLQIHSWTSGSSITVEIDQRGKHHKIVMNKPNFASNTTKPKPSDATDIALAGHGR